MTTTFFFDKLPYKRTQLSATNLLKNMEIVFRIFIARSSDNNIQ